MIKKYLPALCFSLALLCILLLLLAATPSFYSLLQRISHVEEATGYSAEFLEKANHAMRDYLFGLSEHLLIEREGKSLFGAQEVFHMAEVKWLFSVMLKVALALLVLSVYLSRQWKTRLFHHQLMTSLGLLAFLAVASLFFQKAFVIMHKIFFNNDLWMFPAGSPLIALLPQDFFLYFTVILLGVFIGGSLLLYFIERKIHGSSSRT